MMTHHPRELLAGLALDALDPGDERELRDHLAGCGECRAELSELRSLTAEFAHLSPSVDPRPELRTSILRAIDEPSAEAAAAPEPSPSVLARLRGWVGLRPRRALAGLAVAIALVIGGVALGTAIFGGSNARPPGAPQVVAVGDYAHASIGANGRLVLYSAPKQPPPGHVYEAWLIVGKTAHPAAILPAGKRARIDTTLTALPGDTVAITAEPIGGAHLVPTGPVLASVVI